MPGPRTKESPAVVTSVAHRFDLPAVTTVVLSVLTVVLIAVSLTVPWWASFGNGQMTSWYLGTSCVSGTCTGYASVPALAGVFGLVLALVTAALAVSVMALAAFGVSLVWPRMTVLAYVLGLVASVLLLVAPVYLYFALPGALTSSGFPVPVAGFFGSYAGAGSAYSWTGAAGWYLAWLTVLTAFAATGTAVASARRHVAEERALESLTALEPPADDAGPEETEERCCPLCGARYPATAEFCSKDSAPLKDVVP